jgi:uncharacterized membrane protein YfhO
MAVATPAGAHTIRLDYDPPGFRAGMLIALAGALVILALLAIPRPRPVP